MKKSGLETKRDPLAAMAHKPFFDRETKKYLKKLQRDGYFIDVKVRFDARAFTDAGMRVWRL